MTRWALAVMRWLAMTFLMNTPIENRMLEYRRENFAVVIRPAQNPLGPGEVAMEITHNGYQWTNICLLPEEAKKVAEALLANT